VSRKDSEEPFEWGWIPQVQGMSKELSASSQYGQTKGILRDTVVPFIGLLEERTVYRRGPFLCGFTKNCDGYS
jgi:hypothetical protein